MSKAEETMMRLRQEHERKAEAHNGHEPPHWDVRQRLALALMRADGQVNCRNCVYRMRPCNAYKHCEAPDRPHFHPKASLMDRQVARINAIINEINILTK